MIAYKDVPDYVLARKPFRHVSANLTGACWPDGTYVVSTSQNRPIAWWRDGRWTVVKPGLRYASLMATRHVDLLRGIVLTG